MAGENQNQRKAQEDLNHVLQARRDKLAELQAAGKDPFLITKYDVTVHSTDVKNHYEEYEGKEVSLAGRMMFKRVMGKASFCNVQDKEGSIQVYVADVYKRQVYHDYSGRTGTFKDGLPGIKNVDGDQQCRGPGGEKLRR